MQVTIDRLLEGRKIIIKDEEYLSTAEYVAPFLEQMHPFGCHYQIEVQTPEQLTKTDGHIDWVFNRVWIQAIMPESARIGDYDEVYNFVYALDLKTPVFKVFRSYKHKQSEIMVSDNIDTPCSVLSKEEAPKFSIKSIMERTNNVPNMLKRLRMSTLGTTANDRQMFIGNVIDKALLYEIKNKCGKIKLGTKDLVKAYETLFIDTSSDHYVKENSDIFMMEVYEVFASMYVKDKDIVNRLEKTILLEQIFDLF